MSPAIRIILVHTSHPGNIGAAARAMKTMGLEHLYLVAPHAFPDPKAIEMASGATDILERAVVTATLDEALADCTFVAGTSTRSRAIPWPLQSAREFAESLHAPTHAAQTIGLLFGREQSGLTNEELHRCHVHVHIPANADYSSLNLAAAVQICAYEWRMASLARAAKTTPATVEATWDHPPATHQEIENFYTHLEKVLILTGFLNPAAPKQLMTRLRRLFSRMMPDKMEINLLRGILTSIEKPKQR